MNVFLISFQYRPLFLILKFFMRISRTVEFTVKSVRQLQRVYFRYFISTDFCCIFFSTDYCNQWNRFFLVGKQKYIFFLFFSKTTFFSECGDCEKTETYFLFCVNINKTEHNSTKKKFKIYINLSIKNTSTFQNNDASGSTGSSKQFFNANYALPLSSYRLFSVSWS